MGDPYGDVREIYGPNYWVSRELVSTHEETTGLGLFPA